MTPPGIVLVTGATGFIGAEIVARLAAAGCGVVALVHSNPDLVRNNGRRIRATPWSGSRPGPGAVTCVPGDITKNRLGVDPDVYAALRGCLDLVVHTAAITDFGRDEAVYERVNVGGTAQVLDTVADGPQHLPLVQVSTAYVCGERTGPIAEDELDEGQDFRTGYERSKFRAEKMVRAAGGPFAVVRPSIVVGAERTGVTREFQNMYVVIKALTEGRVRSIPGHYDALLDLVPVDHVAEVASTAALRFDEARGRTFHAVGREPNTLRDFSDVMAEYPSFHVPRYVPPSSFDPSRLDAAERVYYDRIVGLYESFFQKRMTFRDENTVELVGRRPSVPAKRFLRRLLNHCLKVGYLGTPLPSVDEVLAELGPRT